MLFLNIGRKKSEVYKDNKICLDLYVGSADPGLKHRVVWILVSLRLFICGRESFSFKDFKALNVAFFIIV